MAKHGASLFTSKIKLNDRQLNQLVREAGDNSTGLIIKLAGHLDKYIAIGRKFSSGEELCSAIAKSKVNG